MDKEEVFSELFYWHKISQKNLDKIVIIGLTILMILNLIGAPEKSILRLYLIYKIKFLVLGFTVGAFGSSIVYEFQLMKKITILKDLL